MRALAITLALALSACATNQQVSLSDGETNCTAMMGRNIDVDTAALAELARMATVAQVAATGVRSQKPQGPAPRAEVTQCPSGSKLCMRLDESGCTIHVNQ
jgi:hypothetical protein